MVKIGDIATLKKFDQFAAFTVENMSVTAPASGLTVTAGSYYAGGAIGCATGGDVTNTNLTNLATVSARGEAGGFIGFSGPGDAIGAGGLNVLGLIKLSGLLSVAQYSSVAVTASNVNGISGGFTVAATGKNENNETTDYAAGGFYGQANSTKTRESHVTNLKSVTADTSTSDGVAGGFVGFSTTGGLADALSNAKDSSVLDNLIKGDLLSVNDLLGAVPYLIPSYTDTTVTYVNGGYVEGDIAGGYAGNFQSGKVNQFSETDLKNDSTLAGVQFRVQTNPVAVVNLDHVTGGAYAGGFGGKVVSGALASAGNGGLSLLGKFGTVDLANLLQVVQGYVPFISYAGVHSDATTVETTSGNKISDPDDPGFTVSATRFDQSDTQSGSAGGYIGYGSGVQVSHSSVTQLRRTDVKEPKNLETAGSIDGTYLSKDSTYAVTAARYAGGYIGKMDIGSAAAVGGGLSLLGQNVNLNDVLSVLDVVVSSIEHSDVTGGIGGYSVLASTADHRNANNEPIHWVWLVVSPETSKAAIFRTRALMSSYTSSARFRPAATWAPCSREPWQTYSATAACSRSSSTSTTCSRSCRTSCRRFATARPMPQCAAARCAHRRHRIRPHAAAWPAAMRDVTAAAISGATTPQHGSRRTPTANTTGRNA